MLSDRDQIVNVYCGDYKIPTRLRFIRHDENTSESAREFVDNIGDHVVTSNRSLKSMPLPEDKALICQGLLWAGTPGSGKTHEAAATLQELIYRYGNSVPLYFVAYADYIHERKQQWALNNKQGMEDRWAEIQCMVEEVEEVEVLMVDDVGKEMDGASGFAASELERQIGRAH